MNITHYRHTYLFYSASITIPWIVWSSVGYVSHTYPNDYIKLTSAAGFLGLLTPLLVALALIMPDETLRKDYPDLDIRRMQIHVVQGADRLLPTMSAKASDNAAKFLRKMGVNIWLKVRAKDYDGTNVFTDKETFKAKTLVWTAGVKGAPTKGLNAHYTKGNRVIVNQVNRVGDYESIFAIGDVASMESEELPYGHPMLASVAVQQGIQLGKNLNRLAKGKEMLPFSYKDKGTMATIGRNLAVVDLNNMKFGGWFAWLLWMFVHLMLLVDFRSRLVVFVNWSWSYFCYDKGTRLIVRKVKDKTEEVEEESLPLEEH